MLRSVSWVMGLAVVSLSCWTNTFLRPLWGARKMIISPFGEILNWPLSGSRKKSSIATGSAGFSSTFFSAGEHALNATPIPVATKRVIALNFILQRGYLYKIGNPLHKRQVQ